VDLTPKKAGQEAELEAIKWSFAEVCFFAVDNRGTVIEVRFNPKSNSLAQSLLRAVIATTEFVRPDGEEDTWIAEELDTTGRYRAKYHRDGSGAYAKQKLEYVQNARGAAGQGHKTSVRSSRAVFLFDSNDTLRSVRSEEVQTWTSRSSSCGESTTS